MGYERGVSENEVKEVVKFFRDFFRLVEVIFEVIGIFFAKFVVKLYIEYLYIENIKWPRVIFVLDGSTYAWSRQKDSGLTF